MTKNFDTLVIGGGSGGLAYAKRAAKLGAKTCLIEADALGGTCVNRGCVPKKLMWEAAWHHVKSAAMCEQGLTGDTVPLDFKALKDRISNKIGSIRTSYDDALEQDNLHRVTGKAELLGPNEVRVNDQDLRATSIVLATGSVPVWPDFEGSDHAEVSDEVFSWTEVPSSLLILGGGYIGCEFAAIFRALGAEVTVVETGERVLDTFDPALSDAVQNVFRARGITLCLGVETQQIEHTGNGLLTRFADGSTCRSSKVVAAIGRAPRTDVPGGFADTLTLADTGAFAVDETLQTSQAGVYAIGDCADRLPLTPVATRDGERLAERLFGDTSVPALDLSYVASAAFVMPPVAQIGRLDNGSSAMGQDLGETVVAPEGHWTTRTVTKTATDDGQMVGAALMGASSPDLISGLGALIAGDAGRVTGVHPGFAEEVVGRD